MSLEKVILANLVYNEDYGRRVIAFLKPEYFTDHSDRVIFELITGYVSKYNAFPSKEALAIDLSNRGGMSEESFKVARDDLITMAPDSATQIEWLLDNTEKWCQDRAIYNAIMQSISIMDDKKDNKGLSRGAIPQLLTDALSVSFDSHIGHDFIEDAEKRFEFYHTTESRVPFDVEILNTITGGGLPNKTLNVLMAGVGVGKTLAMCHMAASHLAMGKRVLYVTLEMAEERIAERIDANLLNLTLDELKFVEKANFLRRVERLRGRTGDGRLVIKEYPTASAGASHIRFLLNELRIKRNFVPDIIYVDYINLCVSSRLKYGSNVNSYTYIKTIAEELRGLAVEINRPIVTATQVNRPGFSSSDLEMTDVAESFGLPATVDFMLALSVSEELIQLGQIMCKQLKNRYSDLNLMKRFVIGVDRPKMRLFNVEANAQENVLDGPVFDKSDFNEKETERGKKRPKYQKKNKFAEFS